MFDLCVCVCVFTLHSLNCRKSYTEENTSNLEIVATVEWKFLEILIYEMAISRHVEFLYLQNIEYAIGNQFLKKTWNLVIPNNNNGMKAIGSLKIHDGGGSPFCWILDAAGRYVYICNI